MNKKGGDQHRRLSFNFALRCTVFPITASKFSSSAPLCAVSLLVSKYQIINATAVHNLLRAMLQPLY